MMTRSRLCAVKSKGYRLADTENKGILGGLDCVAKMQSYTLFPFTLLHEHINLPDSRPTWEAKSWTPHKTKTSNLNLN